MLGLDLRGLHVYSIAVKSATHLDFALTLLRCGMFRESLFCYSKGIEYALEFLKLYREFYEVSEMQPKFKLNALTMTLLDTIARQLVTAKPDWRLAIIEQAEQGKCYAHWRAEFERMGFLVFIESAGIFDRARLRGEEPEDVLRYFYAATRRHCGVEVKW